MLLIFESMSWDSILSLILFEIYLIQKNITTMLNITRKEMIKNHAVLERPEDLPEEEFPPQIDGLDLTPEQAASNKLLAIQLP